LHNVGFQQPLTVLSLPGENPFGVHTMRPYAAHHGCTETQGLFHNLTLQLGTAVLPLQWEHSALQKETPSIIA
jgi:hypothetical protein